MKSTSMVYRLWSIVSVFILATASFNCQDKAGADLIYESSSAGVATGAFSGFKSTFPNAQSVTWTNFRERIWEARFTESAVSKVAVFRTTGALIDQGLLMTQTNLPETARTYLSTQYPGSKIQTVLSGGANGGFRVILIDSTGSRIWWAQFETSGQFRSILEL
ncbi:hypothetical protein [Larkinella rosea]|uniref:Beta-lactamase-inhibitor-like PepSY-like domain-containing protein n=1 Tax=Larkinella rosea TaxID=2025312 RepID=A0A3P1BID9_9BACT|nr:hypothetical protein [Larkinella rosea]RRB00722.1 hypothetical protein EHT25_21230 [Larkinella rosea]